MPGLSYELLRLGKPALLRGSVRPGHHREDDDGDPDDDYHDYHDDHPNDYYDDNEDHAAANYKIRPAQRICETKS